MSQRLFFTIRSLVAVACVVIVALYALQTYESWMSVERETSREAINLAESLAQQTGSALETTDAVLQRMDFWARTRGVAPPERSLLADLLSVRTPSMAGIGELVFFDANGTPVVRSGSPARVEIRASERQAFAWHASHPSLEPFVVPPASASNGLAAITLSRRFNRHGRFGGIVLAVVRVASFAHWYDTVDVGRNGVMSLILSDGTIVARKPSASSFVARGQAKNELLPVLRAAPFGMSTLRSPIDGQKRLIAFHRVDRFPLIVLVGFDTSDAFAAWRSSSILGIIGVCCVLGMIAVLARGLLIELRHNARTQARLSHFASRDGLTGLFNRREFDAAIEREWHVTLRDGPPLSLMMIDVDHFKAYNDRYGHQRGDEALKSVADCLSQICTRPLDLVARYGGEEFSVLLPSTSLDGARVIAERVRNAVAARGVPHEASTHELLTVSIGVAELTPSAKNAPADLIRTADALLYQAKRTGRNCVVSGLVTSNSAQ